MTTVAESHRILVAGMDAEGLPPEEIARRVGISTARVDAILDQLDGVPHEDDQHRAPSVAPAADARARDLHTEAEPIVVGARRRVRPVPWLENHWETGGVATREGLAELGQSLREPQEHLLTPGCPAGAVALLTLPLGAAALTAVADALELAYGPGLRIVGASDGLWFVGAA